MPTLMATVVREPSDFDDRTMHYAQNRGAIKYTGAEQARRIFWVLGAIIFRLTLRPMFGWRRFLLRLFGAKVGEHVHVYPTTKIYMPWNLEIGDWAAIGEDAFIYSLGRVRIGRGVAVAYRAHICAGTHDFSHPDLPLMKPAVTIEDHAWIGTDAFVGPGVTIGRAAIVGARAVVVKDVATQQIVAGNPAKSIGVRHWNEGQKNE